MLTTRERESESAKPALWARGIKGHSRAILDFKVPERSLPIFIAKLTYHRVLDFLVKTYLHLRPVVLNVLPLLRLEHSTIFNRRPGQLRQCW